MLNEKNSTSLTYSVKYSRKGSGKLFVSLCAPFFKYNDQMLIQTQTYFYFLPEAPEDFKDLIKVSKTNAAQSVGF